MAASGPGPRRRRILYAPRHPAGATVAHLPGRRRPPPAPLIDPLLSRLRRMLRLDGKRGRDSVSDGAFARQGGAGDGRRRYPDRSEEHTSALQSLMRISYAVFSLKKKKTISQINRLQNRHNY